MVAEEPLQKLLSEYFFLYHDVQRHNDPPLHTRTAQSKEEDMKSHICQIIQHFQDRVTALHSTARGCVNQSVIEEWTMLTWNILCIDNRIVPPDQLGNVSQDNFFLLETLNNCLAYLVTLSNDIQYTPTDPIFQSIGDPFSNSVFELHNLHCSIGNIQENDPNSFKLFCSNLKDFGLRMNASVELFKKQAGKVSKELWTKVRTAQIRQMITFENIPDNYIHVLVEFYSLMMYRLANISARIQVFRSEVLCKRKMYSCSENINNICNQAFAALELLMSDCILASEPRTNAIFVTNNLFSLDCGALARGVVFKQFEIQVVTEEQAESIQNDIRKQKMLQRPYPFNTVKSAALLAMKSPSGTKRTSSSADSNNPAPKKSDVASKEVLTLYPTYNAKYRYYAAKHSYVLCTTRQKGKHSASNSFQDLSFNNLKGDSDKNDKNPGKRPIFYFHVKATMFSPSGHFADAHTLSLPFTIATRRNQDCQVQRMMSSYTATCFWLYATNNQDGLLLKWTDTDLSWDHFKQLFTYHFKINAAVTKTIQSNDMDLLRYKFKCKDCVQDHKGETINGPAQFVSFKNLLCPHLRSEWGSTHIGFSIWRGMLEILQIFNDTKNNVKKFWESNLIWGFIEYDHVKELLKKVDNTALVRLSFVTGGTICVTLKSNAHSSGSESSALMHLEPLELKKLSTNCVKDYLKDIAAAEDIKYILATDNKLVDINEFFMSLEEARDPSSDVDTNCKAVTSNVTHSGDITSMQTIQFTAMRIAVVTCKVKPPSEYHKERKGSESYNFPANQLPNSRYNGTNGDVYDHANPSLYNNPTQFNPNFLRLPSSGSSNDEFTRELLQLCNFHKKSTEEAANILHLLSPTNFASNIQNIPQQTQQQLSAPEMAPNNGMFSNLYNFQSMNGNGMATMNEEMSPTTPNPYYSDNFFTPSPQGNVNQMIPQHLDTLNTPVYNNNIHQNNSNIYNKGDLI
uniref:NR LBD domain-containing protein n=1 Tax=Rhabditophanes sp. KR3021 TaxID=114890 RepID=A0AC35TYF8_9BILA